MPVGAESSVAHARTRNCDGHWQCDSDGTLPACGQCGTGINRQLQASGCQRGPGCSRCGRSGHGRSGHMPLAVAAADSGKCEGPWAAASLRELPLGGPSVGFLRKLAQQGRSSFHSGRIIQLRRRAPHSQAGAMVLSQPEATERGPNGQISLRTTAPYCLACCQSRAILGMGPSSAMQNSESKASAASTSASATARRNKVPEAFFASPAPSLRWHG